MKVKTDYVPEDCDYLTAGKEYDVFSPFSKNQYSRIVDDCGDQISIGLEFCAHLNGRKWTIIDEKGDGNE